MDHTTPSCHPLSYAIRPLPVLKCLSQLALIVATFNLLPLLLSIIWTDYGLILRYAIVIVLLGTFWLSCYKIRKAEALQDNECYLIIVLAYLVTAFLMAIPMTGKGLSLIDAMFEVISAITTTGLSVANTVHPPVLLFARSWMQWYGGLGVALFALGVGFGSAQVSRGLNLTLSDQDPRTPSSQPYAKRVVLAYSALTIVGFCALALLSVPLFDSLLFILSSVSTGGFSLYNDSIATLPLIPRGVVTLFGLFGSLSLPLYWWSSKKRFKNFLKDRQTQLILLCALGCALFVYFQTPLSISSSLIMGFSAQTTTGFSSVGPATFDPASKLALIGSMLIGGASQSTAGGIKVLRLLLLFQLIRTLFFRTTLTTHTVDRPQGERREHEVVQLERAFTVVVLFFVLTFASWLLFLIGGYPPLDSLFEIISATSTTGLTTGVTSYLLPGYLKATLCVDMIAGRIEFISLFIILYPRTFIGRRMHK